LIECLCGAHLAEQELDCLHQMCGRPRIRLSNAPGKRAGSSRDRQPSAEPHAASRQCGRLLPIAAPLAPPQDTATATLMAKPENRLSLPAYPQSLSLLTDSIDTCPFTKCAEDPNQNER
jgi:hypothetical protein